MSRIQDEEYANSEYSNKKSAFYISPRKWERLRGRCCRVKAEIHMMGKMGEYYLLKLDTAKCDNIGMTRKSLDKYVRDIFLRKPYVTYWVYKWNIMPL